MTTGREVELRSRLSISIHVFVQVALNLLDDVLNIPEGAVTDSSRVQVARDDRVKDSGALTTPFVREERRAQFAVESLLRFVPKLYMIECLLVLLGHLQGALDRLQRDSLSVLHAGGIFEKLLLLVLLAGTQPRSGRSLLVGLLMIDIDSLASDLVLLFEDDLTGREEWVDESRRLNNSIFCPLEILLLGLRTVLPGLILPPWLPTYIHYLFIIILLPQHPPILLIL